MKKLIANIICLCCIACSADKKTYTENGLNGSVKTKIEKQYIDIEQRFGKWEVKDSTKLVMVELTRYDSNGNTTEFEYYFAVIEEEKDEIWKRYYTNHGNKKEKLIMYDPFGKVIIHGKYKYLNNNQYTETLYDTSGNIIKVSTNKINPQNRDVYYYDYTEYENGKPVSQFIREDIVKGDTIFISVTNKKTGIISLSRCVILERDAMGNDTKTLYLDSTNTRPLMLHTTTYEYY